MARRLPVYILADCSGPMSGSPIESVKCFIRELHTQLMSEPSAQGTAYISVITFASTARQLAPLTEAALFTPPELVAGGTTAFGATLRLLIDCMAREVRHATAEVKGDWKPLVFILTAGAPTDSWEQAAEELKHKKIGNVIGLACGERAEAAIMTLKAVTDTVLVMKDTMPESFRQSWKWLPPITLTRPKVGASTESAPQNLPPPPPQITIVP